MIDVGRGRRRPRAAVAAPQRAALVAVLAASVLTAQGALVYVAVDQVGIGGIALPLLPARSGPAAGTAPLQVDPTATPPAATAAPVPRSRLAEAPPPVTAPSSIPSGGAPPVAGTGPTVLVTAAPPPASRPPATTAPAPGRDEDRGPPDRDGRERAGGGDDEFTAATVEDDRPGNRCDDARVDHHDDGDPVGHDCPEGRKAPPEHRTDRGRDRSSPASGHDAPGDHRGADHDGDGPRGDRADEGRPDRRGKAEPRGGAGGGGHGGGDRGGDGGGRGGGPAGP